MWPMWFVPLRPRSSARGSRGADIVLSFLPVWILQCTVSVPWGNWSLFTPLGQKPLVLPSSPTKMNLAGATLHQGLDMSGV